MNFHILFLLKFSICFMFWGIGIAVLRKLLSPYKNPNVTPEAIVIAHLWMYIWGLAWTILFWCTWLGIFVWTE